jgi:hypothetical protein
VPLGRRIGVFRHSARPRRQDSLPPRPVPSAQKISVRSSVAFRASPDTRHASIDRLRRLARRPAASAAAESFPSARGCQRPLAERGIWH